MSGYITGVLAVLGINIVLAYGAYLPMAAGQLNLGIAGFMAVGAYASVYLSSVLEVHVIIAILGGAVAAGLVGIAVVAPVLRTRGIYLALATFALGHVLQAAFLNLAVMGGAAGYPVKVYIGLGAIATFSLVVVGLVLLLSGTRFGINLTALHDDEAVADLFGLNTYLIRAAAFVLGALIAGIAGALYAHHFSFISPQNFSVLLSIYVVLYVLLGGTQSVWGPLVGAVIFTLLPELLRGVDAWRYAIFAVLIIAVMVLRPQGIITGRTLHGLRGLLAGGRAARAKEAR